MPDNSQSTGRFVISLDFELYWGVLENKSLASYSDNLRGTAAAVEALLDTFTDRDIHATWAIVGMLICKDRQELEAGFPALKPSYENKRASTYQYIEKTKTLDPPCHFAPELVQKIIAAPNQEVGSHTFSHYFCGENGQNLSQFADDLAAQNSIMQSISQSPESLVFPRDQVNDSYLDTMARHGIRSYRGLPTHWIYDTAKLNRFRRALKLIDTYINITGHNSHPLTSHPSQDIVNVPASRFLRPYEANRRSLDKYKIRRVVKSMEDAARRGRLYHLWWHPHNFGVNLQKNLDGLEQILDAFQTLNKQYGMQSNTMAEVCDILNGSDTVSV